MYDAFFNNSEDGERIRLRKVGSSNDIKYTVASQKINDKSNSKNKFKQVIFEKLIIN